MALSSSVVPFEVDPCCCLLLFAFLILFSRKTAHAILSHLCFPVVLTLFFSLLYCPSVSSFIGPLNLCSLLPSNTSSVTDFLRCSLLPLPISFVILFSCWPLPSTVILFFRFPFFCVAFFCHFPSFVPFSYCIVRGVLFCSLLPLLSSGPLFKFLPLIKPLCSPSSCTCQCTKAQTASRK